MARVERPNPSGGRELGGGGGGARAITITATDAADLLQSMGVVATFYGFSPSEKATCTGLSG